MAETDAKTSMGRALRHRAKFGLLLAALALLRACPFELRRRAAGALLRRVGPMSRRKRRLIERNLALALPGMSAPEREDLAGRIWEGIGRSMAELHSPRDLKALADRIEVEGPGLDAVEQAHADGRGVLLVSGHYGQWEAVRLALGARGISCGGFYREQSNPHYSKHFADALKVFGEPILPRGRAGTRALIRLLRDGGTIMMLVDQPMAGAPALTFFGQPARTVLSPAEIALKLDVPLIPAYGVRLPGPARFRAIFDAPIPEGTPAQMMQAFNDSLEAQIRACPDQWLWPYDRWDLRRPRAVTEAPRIADADLQ